MWSRVQSLAGVAVFLGLTVMACGRSDLSRSFDIAPEAVGGGGGQITPNTGAGGSVMPGQMGAAGTNGAAGAGGTAGTMSRCGNGVVEPGEQCDSAEAFDNHTCDPTTCQSIPMGAARTTGAAGAGGTAGMMSKCGNGVVEPGEQCDSAEAFDKHICDPLTCQSIPTACGNHLVQPGEQCDDGPSGSPTCSPMCMTITVNSCYTACETQSTNLAACSGTMVTKTSTVVGCAGLATADARANCVALSGCLRAHPNCSISPIDRAHMFVNDDPTACFCGHLDPATCSQAEANTIMGDCAAAYFAVYGGVTNANRDKIISNFFDRTTATGMANNLYACDLSAGCQCHCQ